MSDTNTKGPLAMTTDRVTALLDAYDAETTSLPLGHEMPTRGASTYNWRRSIVDELRALNAASPPSPAPAESGAVGRVTDGSTYDALHRLLSTLHPDEVEAGAVEVAKHWAKFFEASGTPCPTVWWHGGDAIVFNFGERLGDWMLTITDSGVGLLDTSDRRTVSSALDSPPDHGGGEAMSTELVERERQWCLSCGTITRTGRCDCSDDSPEAQRLVNYADGVSSEARKLSEAITALTAEVREAEEENARLEDELYEAKTEPWPRWADEILKTVRRYSGYDGSDDEEGVDLPCEVSEALGELDAQEERAREANTALTAKVAEAEQRIAALMSERSSLIATKAEQLVALTKRATAAEREVALLTEALRPFDGLATVVLSEAPPNADFIIVYTDSSGKKWAMRLDELRAARRAL